MSAGHIPFEILSDLCDDSLPAGEDRQAILRHLKKCRQCSEEMERLKKSIGLCAELGACGLVPCDLAGSILASALKRRRRRAIYRFAPAAAAAVLVISFFAFNQQTGLLTGKGDATARNEKARQESERIIDVLRKNNATLTRVSEGYIEGRVPLDSYVKLRNELDFRKVDFSGPVRFEEEESAQWPSPIEEVGAGDIPAVREKTTSGDGGTYVLFRVHRK